jgi:hypothetical protein
MVVEQTVEVPPSREIRMTAPKAVPTGSVRVIFVFEEPEHAAKVKTKRAKQPSRAEQIAARVLAEPFPTIEELKAEADRKYAERFKDGTDALQKYCGCLKGVYGDGVEYQRKMRDEWPD